MIEDSIIRQKFTISTWKFNCKILPVNQLYYKGKWHATGLLPTTLVTKKAILPVSTLYCRTENYNSFIHQFSLSLKGQHWCLPLLFLQISYWKHICKNLKHCYILMGFWLSHNETPSIISEITPAWTKKIPVFQSGTKKTAKAENTFYQIYCQGLVTSFRTCLLSENVSVTCLSV